MRFTIASISLALAALASATPQNGTSATSLNAVPSSWDGSCFYPKPDIGFQLESYLGKWFQVAGTVVFTAGCKCIQAQYELNVRKSPTNPIQTPILIASCHPSKLRG